MLLELLSPYNLMIPKIIWLTKIPKDIYRQIKSIIQKNISAFNECKVCVCKYKHSYNMKSQTFLP